MKALITGASSGIGRDMARELAKRGYDLILVARRNNLLEEVKENILKDYKVNIDNVPMDLTDKKELEKLTSMYPDIDVLINNAGFGLVGDFDTTSGEKEQEMIDLNVKVLHYLMKFYYQKFAERKYGYILNVASIASYQAGPKMATYYGTKAYVLELSRAVSYEAKKNKNNVVISCLCPGPTDTGFNDVANVKFSLKGDKSDKVAEIAVKGLFKKKREIIPSFKLKLALFAERFLSQNFIMGFTYSAQKKKVDK